MSGAWNLFALCIIFRKMQVLPLHYYPQYKEDICELFSQEWHQSSEARMAVVDSSCDELPTSLVLVSDGQVLGHSRLCDVPVMPATGFIEAVIIHRDTRGIGLGRFLMQKTEELAKSHGMETVFLETTDKKGFYLKNGYTVCLCKEFYGTPTYSLLDLLITTKGKDLEVFSEDLASEDASPCSSSADAVIPALPPHPPSPKPPSPDGHVEEPYNIYLMIKDIS